MTSERQLLSFAIGLLAVSAGWFFSHSFSVAAQTASARVAIPEPDTDGVGPSAYAELQKPFTHPRKANSAGSTKPDGDWKHRKEFPYPITFFLGIAKPFNPADMNDEYQDARVLFEDENS